MHRPITTSLRLLVLGAALGATAACSPTSTTGPATAADAAAPSAQPPVRAALDDASRLPTMLEALQLSAAQRRQLLALRDELKPRLEPMLDAGLDFARAGAKAATACNPNSMALADSASWAVDTGEQVRGDVLDGIDKLHHILTRQQRKALVDRLLGNAQQANPKGETDDGARSLGDSLNLSLSQIVTMVARANALRGAIEDRIEPWVGKAKNALLGFPEDNFAIRKYAIAEIPAVELATRFVRDAFRTMLPILDREQCKALGGFISDAIEKQAASDEPAESS
jgi:Spy/CpxP family protein refolding chaperone